MGITKLNYRLEDKDFKEKRTELIERLKRINNNGSITNKNDSL
jgi:hypothetical protein